MTWDYYDIEKSLAPNTRIFDKAEDCIQFLLDLLREDKVFDFNDSEKKESLDVLDMLLRNAKFSKGLLVGERQMEIEGDRAQMRSMERGR